MRFASLFYEIKTFLNFSFYFLLYQIGYEGCNGFMKIFDLQLLTNKVYILIYFQLVSSFFDTVYPENDIATS